MTEEDIVFNWVDKWFHDATDRFDEHYHHVVWTIKFCDVETSQHLYNRSYNPFSIAIMRAYKDPSTFSLKAMIHSIDDSSYGAWVTRIPLERAIVVKEKIMEYVSDQKIMNGEKFFEFMRTMGSKDEDFDTN